WRMEGASEALDWFRKRMKEGVPIEKALEEERSNHPMNLAMVNIEAVYPRWVDKVGDFLTAADTQVSVGWKYNIASVMKDDEREFDETTKRYKPKAVEGGGWVIELRGYTYHKEGRTFVRDALL